MDKYLKLTKLFQAPDIVQYIIFGEYMEIKERGIIITACMTPPFNWFVRAIQPAGPLTSAIAAANL